MFALFAMNGFFVELNGWHLVFNRLFPLVSLCFFFHSVFLIEKCLIGEMAWFAIFCPLSSFHRTVTLSCQVQCDQLLQSPFLILDWRSLCSPLALEFLLSTLPNLFRSCFRLVVQCFKHVFVICFR